MRGWAGRLGAAAGAVGSQLARQERARSSCVDPLAPRRHGIAASGVPSRRARLVGRGFVSTQRGPRPAMFLG